MDNAIVGVRYIGKKDRQEDTVCKTGAVWLPGQVHNFAGGLAKRLIQHTDSFELADIDMDGQTFMAAGKTKARAAVPYINLSAMSPEQLVHMARFEFNRVVNPEGKSVDQLRQEVQSLMVSHSLDLAEDERNQPTEGYCVPMIYQASPEEAAALRAGLAVLRVVPVIAEIPEVAEPEATEQADSLVAEVMAMDKDDLVALALDRYTVKLDKRKSIDDLREQVIEIIHTAKDE